MASRDYHHRSKGPSIVDGTSHHHHWYRSSTNRTCCPRMVRSIPGMCIICLEAFRTEDLAQPLPSRTVYPTHTDSFQRIINYSNRCRRQWTSSPLSGGWRRTPRPAPQRLRWSWAQPLGMLSLRLLLQKYVLSIARWLLLTIESLDYVSWSDGNVDWELADETTISVAIIATSSTVQVIVAIDGAAKKTQWNM